MTVNELLEEFEVLIKKETKENLDLSKEKESIKLLIKEKVRRAILTDRH